MLLIVRVNLPTKSRCASLRALSSPETSLQLKLLKYIRVSLAQASPVCRLSLRISALGLTLHIIVLPGLSRVPFPYTPATKRCTHRQVIRYLYIDSFLYHSHMSYPPTSSSLWSLMMNEMLLYNALACPLALDDRCGLEIAPSTVCTSYSWSTAFSARCRVSVAQ